MDMGDRSAVARASTEPTPSPASKTYTRGPEDIIVQIGDVLDVNVAEDRSFNGYYEVRVGGYFILPAVGRIDAVGLPLRKIQVNITKALEETQLPHATVRVSMLGNPDGGWRR